MKNAVVLLTVRPNKGQVDFFRQMERENLDLFVLADDNQVDGAAYEGIRLIQIDDRLCRDKGFRRFNPMIPKPFECSAWDKALYYFSSVNHSYDNVWIVEEDVFVSSPDTISRLDTKYGEADIISAANNVNEAGELESWFWWRHIPVDALPLPWAWSMVCGVRLSRAALQAVKEFVALEETQNASCLNIEFVFHTLALHQGLKVVVAEELKGVVWRKDWSTPELLGDGLYHPIKDVERHAVLRKEIENFTLHQPDMSEQATYQVTNDWFVVTAKNVWDRLVPRISPTRILEIGSYEGSSTCYFIDTLASRKSIELHCIDTWEGGVDNAGTDMSAVEQRFLHNTGLAVGRAAHRVDLHCHKSYSDVALARLLAEGKRNYFDFVYVDGSHQAPDVLCDAVLGFRLLRAGGVMVFDDYLWAESLPYGVDPIRCPKPAVDAFTTLYARKIRILREPLYQLYIEKISD
jgi:predicted O-methyltransferase YrrM